METGLIDPTTPRQPRPAPRRRPSRIGRVLALSVMLVLSAAALYGGYLYHSSGFIKRYLPAILHPKTVADVFPNQQTMNLLVIGQDYDYNNSDQVIKTSARSDMLMVARLDFAQNKITLFSIPRDTQAAIPDHGVHKINAAHAYGGPALTAQTVQTNFGISTDKYIGLDFQGFEKAIDILGGVDLTVDKQMDYDDNWGHLHIHLKPGYQHLDGAQAMGFVRFRHADSDLVRIQRQQALLAAFKEKLRQPQTLAELPELLDTVDKHIDSDLSDDQRVALARFLHDTPREQLQLATLPSREEGNTVSPNWPLATPMIQRIFGVAPPEDIASLTGTSRHRRHHRRHYTRLAQAP